MPNGKKIASLHSPPVMEKHGEKANFFLFRKNKNSKKASVEEKLIQAQQKQAGTRKERRKKIG